MKKTRFRVNIKKRIKKSPMVLMVLMSTLGGLYFLWTGAIIGGITGFILDITLGYNTKSNSKAH